MPFGLFKKNLACLGLILGIFFFGALPTKPITSAIGIPIPIYPFGGRVVLVIPPAPPVNPCPCIQYVITNPVSNAVRVVASCPFIPTSVPRNNPSPVMGCAVLGIAIPNPIVICPNTYLPILWGASFTP
jgi:hypothetical protein